jgi:hypothetical protein
MQINQHARTFTQAGVVYSYDLTVRQVLGLGTSYDVQIKDPAGRIVASRQDVYVAKDMPVEQSLGPALQAMMDNRPTLTDLRTQQTAHSPQMDMGPTRPSLWS